MSFFSKTIDYLLIFLLIFLPLQTRWLYAPGVLNGEDWEYGTLSLYGTEILGGLVILLFLIDRSRVGDWYARVFSRANWHARRWYLAGAFVVLLFVGWLVARSGLPAISYQYAARSLLAVCSGLIIYIFSVTSAKKNLFLFSFWTGGILQAVLAVTQFLTQNIWANKWLGMSAQSAAVLGASVVETSAGRFLRAYGTFGSPNALGIYLAMIFFVGLILSIRFAPKNYWWFAGGQTLLAAGVFFSFSRSAAVGALVGVISLIIYFWRDPAARQVIGEKLVYCVLCWLALGNIFFPLLTTRINVNNRLEKIAVNERLEQIQSARVLFKDNWLWGVGPGLYSYALYQSDPGQHVWAYEPVHNIFVLGILEWGAVGLSILLYLSMHFRRVVFKNFFWPAALLLAVLGLFDHWLLSMWSGLLATAVFLGLLLKSEAPR